MPLLLSREEFNKLVSWTDGSRENRDAARQSEYVKRLNELSSKMTRDWPNSFENVNKRNEEIRRARIEAAEQANTKFYKKYMRNKRDEQARLMYSARDTMFKNKDAPKMFLRAVIETCIQAERVAQLKFKAEREQEERDLKRKEDEEIHRRAAEWHALMKTRKQRRFEADKKNKQEILEQANERRDRERNEHETELNYQIVDNIKAAEQMEALAEFERNFNAAEKARILRDMKQSKAEVDARRAEEKARDQLDDKLIAVLQRSRARVEALRKKTEKESREEQLRILEMNSKRLATGTAARDEKERRNLEAAVAKNDAALDARLRADAEKLVRQAREKRELHEKFLADEAQRIHELDTMKQWEMMNRFKNQELYEEYKEKQRQEKARKIKEFKEDTLKLWKEREERDKRERAETRYFYGELAERKLRDADNRLFAHAQELLAEARRHGRPDYALKKALDRYCCMYRLHPMPPLPSTLQSHFPGYAPKDSCIPDPDYKPPEPPLPEPDPEKVKVEQPAPAAPGVKTNGLQPEKSKVQAEPSKPAAEEGVADYKRVGRANGMQKTPAEMNLLQRPLTITAVACPTPACPCPLNPAMLSVTDRKH